LKYQNLNLQQVKEKNLMGEKLELLIIGGSAAGPTAAGSARRKAPEANITMLEKGEFVSVGS
jgi:succinate dehydrogenase/fumarate reductase flavoprotein subunit